MFDGAEEMSEARYLETTFDEDYDREELEAIQNGLDAQFRFILAEEFRQMKIRYDLAANAKVGTMIICPACKKAFKKNTYHQKFCKIKCKDRYHNIRKELEL